MEFREEIISAVIFTLVSLFIFRKPLIDKLNDILDLFELPIVDFSKEENKVYEPIYFKSITPLGHYCEPHQPLTFENRRTKTATEVLNEHRAREQEIINNFKYEKENDKMTKKQLIEENRQLHIIARDYRDEAIMLRNELRVERNHKRIEFATVTETKLFVATQEEIEKARCCETCEAFTNNFNHIPFPFDEYQDKCENKIISSYEDVDTEETKCKEHQFNEKKLINMIKEMRADKEHTERVKKAKPTIVKYQEEK